MSLTAVSLALYECEHQIEEGMANQAFAVKRIHDEKLYRERWDTFENYVSDRWGWSRQHGHRLINHAVTLAAIESPSTECNQIGYIVAEPAPTPPRPMPTSEGQTRSLASLPIAERADAWAEAVEVAADRGKLTPTGAIVAEVVEQRKPERRPQSDEHPAKFSRALVDVFVDVLAPMDVQRICDPFAGTGRVHEVADMLGVDSIGVEIETKWAAMHDRTMCADSTVVDFDELGPFDCIVTSPTYGNRMADKHDARDDSDRATYKHRLGSELTDGNTGGMQWTDPTYKATHEAVWRRFVDVLPVGGVFVLNVKDHVRDGQRQRVSAWHLSCLIDCGMRLVDDASISSAGLAGSAGSNAGQRFGIEHVYVMQKGTTQ
jgi:hypothetical protein